MNPTYLPTTELTLDTASAQLIADINALSAGLSAQDLTPVHRRALYLATNALLTPTDSHDDVQRLNLDIPLAERTLKARQYRAQKTSPLPSSDVLLVFFHGGGWVVGDLDSHDTVCAFIAKQLGCTVLSVEYRKAPECPYPAALNDAIDAYGWAWKHLAQFACKRIAVGGDSAGAYLAAHAMYLSNQVQTAGALLFYPATDLNFGHTSYLERGSGPGLGHAGMLWYWEQFLGVDQLQQMQDAVGRGKHYDRVLPAHQQWQSAPPPCVVSVAWFDPLHDEGLEYARQLQAAGGIVTVLTAQDMAHGFIRQCRVNDSARQHVEQAVDAFASLLA